MMSCQPVPRKEFGTESHFRKNNVHKTETRQLVLFGLRPGRPRIRYRSLLWAYSRPSWNKNSGKLLFLMDENYCFQCFCAEKHEKCVRPDKDLSLKAALQGREKKIKRLLCRNQETGLTGNRAATKPGNQATRQPSSKPWCQTINFLYSACSF